MIVFSSGERDRKGPPLAGEAMFSYLDTSSRDEAAKAREIIEKWVKDYPEDQLDHWLGNFRSQDDGQHDSAFFELFLFQYFSALGCEITAIEPELEGQTGNPDFLIKDPEGREIVVEAISPNYESDTLKGSQKLIADIKDAINTLKLANHYLVLERIEAPASSINKRKLKQALQKWIDSEPDEETMFEYQDKGALVQIKVIHRPGCDVDAPAYRAIGIEMGGVSVSTPGEDIRRGLEKKAAKYRRLGRPYIIALNARSFHDTEDDYLAATYGTISVVIRIGADGNEHGDPETVRNTDGLFNEGGRPRKKNVSAVLLFNGVKPWQWQDRRSALIHNAYAEYPLAGLTLGGDAWFVSNNRLSKVEGASISDLL